MTCDHNRKGDFLVICMDEEILRLCVTYYYYFQSKMEKKQKGQLFLRDGSRLLY